MIEDFKYVLENYPNADLSKEEDREIIARALSNIMTEHHIISYTDLDAVKDDKKMMNWIERSKIKKDDRDIESYPIERGL
tara:strand:- start:1010 stop:1249 length:240 start_codon:yes stop_codon:yes gene_type:complete